MSLPTGDFAGERITFRELFSRHPHVKIPLIQRDYAQGRKTAAGLRGEFLQALSEALRPEDEKARPLDLDFVYGNIASEPNETFLPLDGQQRLTTLFLLHWYAAWRDGEQTDFVGWISEAKRSRLRYAVRTSSEEFFDQLVTYYPPETTGRETPLSKRIEDEPWFFRRWKLDPTIRGVLTMLDDIDAQFAGQRELYRLLGETTPPRITFQLLNLGDIGLTDDLYIKMNARGKPLTPFENFKARLEPLLLQRFPNQKRSIGDRSVSLQEYFTFRIDGAWADLFWSYRDEEKALFDDKAMRLLRALMLVTRNPDAEGAGRLLERLRNQDVEFSFFSYNSEGCLDETFLGTLISSLDRWTKEQGGLQTWLPPEIGLDEEALFSEVLEHGTGSKFESLLRLQAFCGYLQTHQEQIDPVLFGEWMRVILNLSVNTEYRSIEDFRRCMRGVNALLPYADRVLAHLADPACHVEGFDAQQVREEQLKAQLIGSPAWRAAIRKAERHPWFEGQIEFLLSFSGILDRWLPTKSASWSAEEDAGFLERFLHYHERAVAMVGSDGLRELPEFLWERALLTVGDYLLPKGQGGYNWSFLENNKQREASWKRLLRGAAGDAVGGLDAETKRQRIKALWDNLDPRQVEQSLRSLVSQALLRPAGTDGWRLRLIQEPRHLDYCKNRISHWPANRRVYLLHGKSFGGYFVELFSYHLRWRLLPELLKDGLLAPFDFVDYRQFWGKGVEPFAVLSWCTEGQAVELRITTTELGFRLELIAQSGNMPSNVTRAFPQLIALGWVPTEAHHGLAREIDDGHEAPEASGQDSPTRAALIETAAALNGIGANTPPED